MGVNYNPYSLEGKTILVTGASSGIGKGAAIECSKMGAKVIITARNEERLKEIVHAELFSARNRHNSLIIIKNQCRPLGVDDVQVPRLGINQAAVVNECVPFRAVDGIMFYVVNHWVIYSNSLRYISGQPTQRFSPPRVSL